MWWNVPKHEAWGLWSHRPPAIDTQARSPPGLWAFSFFQDDKSLLISKSLGVGAQSNLPEASGSDATQKLSRSIDNSSPRPNASEVNGTDLSPNTCSLCISRLSLLAT